MIKISLSQKEEQMALQQKRLPRYDTYGLIVYHQNPGEEPVFHISQRRDTVAYIRFIQGLVPFEKLEMYFSKMTVEEKERIRTYFFEELWMDLFSSTYYRLTNQFDRAKAKFEMFRDNGVLEKVYQSTLNKSIELDWGFPKGRKKDRQEADLICAIREYREETRNKCYLEFVDCLPLICSRPFGAEKITYYIAKSRFRPRPKYYTLNVGKIQRDSTSDETSDLRWVTLSEANNILPEIYKELLQEIVILFKQCHSFLLLQDVIAKYRKSTYEEKDSKEQGNRIESN
jgi:8-oxo-dGTP pyrophosphatase MutT (NUDIX family)